MVYFLKCHHGPIKIGSTGDLRVRLKQLASEFGFDFEVMAIMNGRVHEENAIHAKFSHIRIKREFFQPSSDLLSYIDENARPWDGVEDDWQPREKKDYGNSPGMGSILAENLCRLGYGRRVFKVAEIAKLITERTGKTMSRQRIRNLLNSVRITEATLATIAEALGVEVSELRRIETPGD